MMFWSFCCQYWLKCVKRKFDAIVKRDTSKGGLIWIQKIWVEKLQNDKLEELLDKLREIDSKRSESLFDIEYYSNIIKHIFSIYEEGVDMFDDSENYLAYVVYLFKKLLCASEEL